MCQRDNRNFARRINMKHIKFILLLVLAVAIPANAQYYDDGYISYQNEKPLAMITFKNKSPYHMTIKIIGLYGGLHEMVILPAHSSKNVYFDHTATYKTKIKASLRGNISYHKGGRFSVTCNETEWTEGEMSFQLATYGQGLGPKISAKEFESNK